MKKLVLLYWGTVFLMYLSQTYYPVDTRLTGSQVGKRHFMWRKSDIFMVIVISWMTCFSFLRTHYNDTGNYIYMYNDAKTVQEFLSDGDLLDLTGNPLSYFYQSWMHDITDNIHVYFFLPAFLSSFAAIKLFKGYSPNPALSILIFFSIATYAMYIAALKQRSAVFFLLLSIPYAERKQYGRFYLLVFIAILFHTHAFMFAILPFLFEKPWGKVTWLLLGATLFAMATYNTTLGAFMRYAQSVGAFVAEDEVFDGHSINTIRVLVYWVPAVIALFFRRRLFGDSSRMENLFVNMSIVSAFILTIGMVEGANLYARMAGYFEIATAVVLPWMITKLFEKRSAHIINIAASALYFGYFYYEFTFSKGFDADYSAITLWQFIQSLFP